MSEHDEAVERVRAAVEGGCAPTPSEAASLLAAYDALHAEVAALREQYAGLCLGDPYSGDAFVPPVRASVTLTLRNERDALRERVERLREDVRGRLGSIVSQRREPYFRGRADSYEWVYAALSRVDS